MSKWTLPKPRGRMLVCTVCGLPVDVLEAVQGARTEEEHRFLDPVSYVCGSCAVAATNTAEAA